METAPIMSTVGTQSTLIPFGDSQIQADRDLHIGDVSPPTHQYIPSIYLQALHHLETPPTQRYAISARRKRTKRSPPPLSGNAGTVLKLGATLVPALAWPTNVYTNYVIPTFQSRACVCVRCIPISAAVWSVFFPVCPRAGFRYWSVCVGRGQCPSTMRAGRSAW